MICEEIATGPGDSSLSCDRTSAEHVALSPLSFKLIASGGIDENVVCRTLSDPRTRMQKHYRGSVYSSVASENPGCH